MSNTRTVRLSCTLRREKELHVASCLEIPASGCAPTAEQALAKLRQALEVYFADGGPIPETKVPSVEYLDFEIPTGAKTRKTKARRE